MKEWLQPGILVWPALAMVIFGAWGAIIWPGPFPSILIPMGIFALMLLSAWANVIDDE